jgi:hypothetical protein
MTIPAAEYLGICIILADYDLEITAMEVIARLKAFQDDTIGYSHRIGMNWGKGSAIYFLRQRIAAGANGRISENC